MDRTTRDNNCRAVASAAIVALVAALFAGPAMSADQAGPSRLALQAANASAAGVNAASAAALTSTIEPDKLARDKRSDPGLYVTAREAAALLEAHPEFVMVDIRSRAEVAFLGMPVAAAKNIPYMDVDGNWEFDARKGEYKLAINPDFATAMQRFLDARRLDRTATILLLCRSGTRSAKAASYLAKLGYTRVYSVVDGFEGDKGKAGQRDVNGWKNGKLAWSYKLRADQVYESPSL